MLQTENSNKQPKKLALTRTTIRRLSSAELWGGESPHITGTACNTCGICSASGGCTDSCLHTCVDDGC